eukprot:338697-Pleurochrysis_carterae.AAC.1
MTGERKYSSSYHSVRAMRRTRGQQSHATLRAKSASTQAATLSIRKRICQYQSQPETSSATTSTT